MRCPRYLVPAVATLLSLSGSGAAQDVPSNPGSHGGMLEVRLRYKSPWAEQAVEVNHVLPDNAGSTDNLVFASSVASFGMILSGSKYKGSADFDMARRLGEAAVGPDDRGLRAEYLKLIGLAESPQAVVPEVGQARRGGRGRGGGRRGVFFSGSMDATFSAVSAEPQTGETYGHVGENDFKSAAEEPLSTFGVDVDTASYTNIRRMLNYGQLPPPDAVRVEEMINYFRYEYPAPVGTDSFSITTERGPCPWEETHELVLIGLRGKEMEVDRTPPRNLVFLMDVSGSMNQPQKLPLVKASLTRLVKGLTDRDTVAVVTYAGQSGVALEPTSCKDKRKILDCIDGLGAGGSTNGAGGIQAAYELARKNFYRENINRVILVSDGDFNVGISEPAQLQALIEKERESGVFLTVVGVGTGNLDDETMSTLAKHGNGQYIHLDSEQEARRAFEEGLIGTLVTIAKDVKLQVEFDPAAVDQYRLIGYERRIMREEDFRNDAKDSGEIGAGHAVTALYEIVPANKRR